MANDSRKLPSLLLWISLVLILCVALWLRTDDLIAWHYKPHRAFHDNQPLLTNFDGYYYLAQARDLLDGSYDDVDSLRGVPESPPRPAIPPLLSVLAAGLTAATSLPLNWIAVLLPAILGLTLAIPIALIGRLFSGRIMLPVVVAMALFPSYTVYRSNVGWFDTDCLNVTFLLSVCYLFLRFGHNGGPRRYYYLAGGFVTMALFLIWWDQAPAIVAVICLSPLAIVLALDYRPKGRERAIAIAVGVAVIVALAAWRGPELVATPFERVSGQFAYISKQEGAFFPNVSASVSEQRPLAVAELIQKSAGHPLSFVAGILGLAGLFWRDKRRAAPLLVPFAIGCLSFLFARRFLIFLNPFIALGVGFSAQWLWELRRRWRPFQYAAIALILSFVLVPARESLSKIYWPAVLPQIVKGMADVSQETDPGAVAWAWWDHGYPLRYWGQRATICDGGLHGGLLTVCNAIPLVADDPAMAANFMHFYIHRGLGGMQSLFDAVDNPTKAMPLLRRVLASGPEHAPQLIRQAGLAPVSQWNDFFFPKQERELFLFLDLRVARTSRWWHWYGTWDVAKGDGRRSLFRYFLNCRLKDNVVVGDEIRADLEKGVIDWSGRRYPVSVIWQRAENGWARAERPNPGGLVFMFDAVNRVGAVMKPQFAHTLFGRLYLFGQPDSNQFSLYAQHLPYYQIWRVHPSATAGHQIGQK